LPRRRDGVLRQPENAADERVRRVRHNGAIRWRGGELYIGQALTGEPVGPAEQPDGSWLVRYGPIVLGIIDHRGDRLRRPALQVCGFVDNPGGLPTTPQTQQPHQQT